MAHPGSIDTLYLQLPARTAASTDAHSSPLHLALAMRARPLRTATASLSELAPQLMQVSRVVLLLAASDVTLLRMAVPPLTATRLQAALPSLVEEFVIGDAADCAIAVGPETDGQRLIAITDRAWLQHWVSTVQQLGAHNISVLPISLCLPISSEHLSAALLVHGHRYELALRLSPHEGIGLPLVVEDETQLAGAVAQLLHTLAPEHSIQLSVPKAQAEWLRHGMPAQNGCDITIIEQQWSDWIAASAHVPVDLISAVEKAAYLRIDWKAWRWPIAVATTVALLNIIALNADWWRLRNEGTQLRDEITSVYRQSFPNETVLLDPLAQMKQKIAATRKASGELTPSDFVVLSAALGEVWHETGNDMRAIATLEYRDATLSVKLKQGAQISMEVMRNALAARQLQLIPSTTDPLLWQLKAL
jgi:general secretion pathway protein L